MSSSTAATVVQTIVYALPTQVYGTTTTFASSYLAQGLYTTVVTWKNLGPLTSTFTAFSSCSTIPLGGLTVYSTDTDGDIASSWPCDSGPGTLPRWAECQPSARVLSSLLSASPSYDWMTYLSPGVYCPSNYSTALAVTLDSDDIATRTFDGYLVRTTGTHVYCCPSGYFSSLGYCVTDVATAISTTLCDPLYSSPAPFVWHPGQKQNVIVQRTAYPVYMIHQQSDIPGLSKSTKIAIGVVVPVVVLMGIILGLLFFLRRAKRKKASQSKALSGTDAQEAKRQASQPFLKTPGETEQKNKATSDDRREDANVDPRKPVAGSQSAAGEGEAKGQGRKVSPKKPSTRDKRGWHWV